MLNQQMQAVLDSHAALRPKPIETLSPAEARRQPTLGQAIEQLIKSRGGKLTPEAVHEVVNTQIPTADGPLNARIYKPDVQSEKLPVLIYFHGGGWVIGSLDAYDSSCRALANASSSLVISCDYRQAPEFTYPAAPMDALAAYQWILTNVESLGGDKQRIAIGGESAGANLATVTAIQARDQGIPQPIHQLLIYPVTQFSTDTASYERHAEAKPLNRAMMTWFIEHYLPNPLDRECHIAAPIKTTDFGGLPPATIITAEIDPLLTDSLIYMQRLESAGTPICYRNYVGVAHEFFGMGAVIDQANEAVKFAAEQLRTAFALPLRAQLATEAVEIAE